jgi:hypothetical protein
MFSDFPTFIMSPNPIPPTPIEPTFNFSDGGVEPGPPSTWRGTIIHPAVLAAADKNTRRDGLPFFAPTARFGESDMGNDSSKRDVT